MPSTLGVSYSVKISGNSDQNIVSKISRQIEIPADSDYYVKFQSDNSSFKGQKVESYSSGLTEKVKAAIAKSPNWIQRQLTRQFHSLNNAEDYADLILNAAKKYTDEIAFSIACSPLGMVPTIDLIEDNVFFLYENDKWIKYADIVDYDDGLGGYYSTIRYKVIENGTEKQFEYPKDIYYWYVVHPKLSTETPEHIYGKIWRDYLFNHNDLGYPLLKEKLSNIEYLWDCESYHQPKHRLWKESIENHPTAIEAISYWIGKTVPFQAIGDRPPQPNIIAHEHNGWCGELQRIAVAAQRTSLIPSVGACNVGEDHVWREFYERGWHQNDNWWADGGGTVDIPDVYEYGWGKNMSAVYAWRGDDSIYELTSRYIHPEDRYTIRFSVRDIYLQPIDGARVSVLVHGPKDITWIKNKIWEKIEEIWDRLPRLIKGKILQAIYNKIKERFDEIPDIIDGLTATFWNYTDANGECVLELGRGHNYILIIQQGNLRRPWQLANYNTLRILRTPRDKTFRVLFLDVFHRTQRHRNKVMPEGECFFDVSFDTESYQLQKNIYYGNIGCYDDMGKIDFFVLDEENFEKYKSGKKFNCFNYVEEKRADISFSAIKNDWYIVFRNHARRTNIIVDFLIQAEASTDVDVVEIVTPDTTIFDKPFFNVGETVNITGIASKDVNLSIDGETIEISPVDDKWFYKWNTSETMPGDYLITAICSDAHDELLITLIDEYPPDIRINEPMNEEIVEEDVITISGVSWDDVGVDRVEVAVDGGEFIEASGKEDWFIEWDISGLELGEHIISARAIDLLGKELVYKTSIVVNESGHDWGPLINSFYHLPQDPTNISNIVVYANVTNGSPFDVKRVVLYRDNGTETNSYDMYRYGDNPVQGRHEEDPLFNESNEPLFGFELGQFSSGEFIKYWIVSYDSANNSRKSSEKSFLVGRP
ncbi:MAG: hypothetical protein JSW60_03485 [Thermoplasmatales archaeon]|nr:MAG: hypothetical protein JSW60_03485 [Thermoplasmatales archaeon]